MQSSKCNAAHICCEDGHESFLHSGESMNEGDEGDVHADIRWRPSKSNDGLYHDWE